MGLARVRRKGETAVLGVEVGNKTRKERTETVHRGQGKSELQRPLHRPDGTPAGQRIPKVAGDSGTVLIPVFGEYRQ